MARIFITGSGQNRGWHTGSGVLSLPVRIQLRDQDARRGQYPTIIRTGDSNYLGNSLIKFDDTKAAAFGKGETVWPNNMLVGSNNMSGNVATPSVSFGITGPGTGSVGLTDLGITFQQPAAISPFVENRLYIDETSAFYATGTSESVLPGFSQKLSSKTSFSLDISPVVTTSVYWSTGTGVDTTYASSAAALDAGVNPGVAYYNWNSKKWEIIGDLTTGSNVDYLSEFYETARGSYLCTVPSTKPNSAGGDLDVQNPWGLPVSTFGFPFASKFDASAGQTKQITGSIAHPFLVEKVVLEFTGTVSGPAFDEVFGSPTEPAIKTFMLMRQSNQNIAKTHYVDATFRDWTAAPPTTIVNVENEYAQTKHRDIVWFGRVGTYEESAFSSLAALTGSHIQIAKSADLWVPTSDWGGPSTGSFRIAAPCRSIGIGKNISPMIPNRRLQELLGDTYPVGNIFGGTSLSSLSGGRSYIRSVVGNETSGTFQYATGFSTPTYTDLYQDAPFVLMPSDRLVLAVANQIAPNLLFSDTFNEHHVFERDRLELSVGESKITLYGSLLRNTKPIEPMTNQFLTSNAVHEDIKWDIPVMDQFEVEPRVTLSGSYSDNIITGSMLVSPMGSDIAQNVRRVQSSVANGTAGTTGSLQRFVRLTDSSGPLYDSFGPDITKTFVSTGLGLLSTSSWGAPVNVVAIDAPDDGITSQGIDNHWWLRPAFEKTAIRSVGNFIRGSHATYNTAGTLQGTFTADPSDALYIPANAGLVPSPNFVRDNDGSVSSPEAAYRSYKALFGFGNGKFNTPRFVPNDLTDVVSKGYNVEIRGYKYGLAGIGGSTPDARFRRSRFGQFRDMLEQRKYPATIRNGSVEYPVEIIFKSREGVTASPENTHSQNLSTHASSSFPYYDGLTVDRADDPDTSLVAVDIVIS